MNTENSKINESRKFVCNLQQRLDLRGSNKYVALQNFSVYYTRKSIKQQYKINKLKIISPAWKDVVELPDGSYSVLDIQDYIEYIMEKTQSINH